MNITKDEALILSEAVYLAKYDIKDMISSYEDQKLVYKALEELENKLSVAGRDERRNGRTSQNDFSDVLKRYAKRNRS